MYDRTYRARVASQNVIYFIMVFMIHRTHIRPPTSVHAWQVKMLYILFRLLFPRYI